MFHVIDTADYPLIDPESESKYEFRLEESIQLAKSKKLLAGVSVISTPKVIPGPMTLKTIINAAGGNVRYIFN